MSSDAKFTKGDRCYLYSGEQVVYHHYDDKEKIHYVNRLLMETRSCGFNEPPETWEYIDNILYPYAVVYKDEPLGYYSSSISSKQERLKELTLKVQEKSNTLIDLERKIVNSEISLRQTIEENERRLEEHQAENIQKELEIGKMRERADRFPDISKALMVAEGNVKYFVMASTDDVGYVIDYHLCDADDFFKSYNFGYSAMVLSFGKNRKEQYDILNNHQKTNNRMEIHPFISVEECKAFLLDSIKTEIEYDVIHNYSLSRINSILKTGLLTKEDIPQNYIDSIKDIIIKAREDSISEHIDIVEQNKQKLQDDLNHELLQ